MFKSIARLGAAFIAAAAVSFSASATTFSIDYTDLWGGGQPTPSENGWGLNLIQQSNVIFATMFVYGPDGTARWFSASDLAPSGGGTTWSGSLAQTTGTYYGAPWAGNAVATVVGTMTISFSSANTGNLTYTVGGVTVNKAISRFSLRREDLGGHYLGGAVATCSNGSQILIFDDLRISQNAAAVSMSVNFFTSRGLAATCTYTGTMTSTGRTGSIAGSYSCTGDANNAGSFTITNLDTSINGFNGNLTASDQFCTGGMTGRFGGVKDVLP